MYCVSNASINQSPRQRGRVVKAMPCYLFRDIIGIVFARVGSNPAVVAPLFAFCSTLPPLPSHAQSAWTLPSPLFCMLCSSDTILLFQRVTVSATRQRYHYVFFLTFFQIFAATNNTAKHDVANLLSPSNPPSDKSIDQHPRGQYFAQGYRARGSQTVIRAHSSTIIRANGLVV